MWSRQYFATSHFAWERRIKADGSTAPSIVDSIKYFGFGASRTAFGDIELNKQDFGENAEDDLLDERRHGPAPHAAVMDIECHHRQTGGERYQWNRHAII